MICKYVYIYIYMMGPAIVDHLARTGQTRPGQAATFTKCDTQTCLQVMLVMLVTKHVITHI